MNKICNPPAASFLTSWLMAVLAAFCSTFLYSPAHAQESTGAFRLVNATGLEGKAHFFLNGEDVSSTGYIMGENTGNLGIPAGMWEVRAEHPLCEDAKMQIQVNPGQHQALIAYVEPLKDAQTGEVKKRVLKFGKIESKVRGQKRSASLLFLSVSNQVEISMNGTPVVLTPNKQVDIDFGSSRGTGVSIQKSGIKIGGLNIEDLGDYAVVVYDKADGTQGCVTFYNSK